MTTGTYRIKIYLTGLDKDRAKELRYVMHEFMKGSGKSILRDMMKRAYEGERVLLYQSNDDHDAEAIARALTRTGAEIEVEGMRAEEEPF